MSIKNNLCISVISSVVAILLLFYTLVVIFNLNIDNIQQYQYNLHIASSFLMNPNTMHLNKKYVYNYNNHNG